MYVYTLYIHLIYVRTTDRDLEVKSFAVPNWRSRRSRTTRGDWGKCLHSKRAAIRGQFWVSFSHEGRFKQTETMLLLFYVRRRAVVQWVPSKYRKRTIYIYIKVLQ